MESELNAILFVYRSRSSGKSTLVLNIAKELKDEPLKFIWNDLRQYAIEKIEDALSILLGAKGYSSVLLKLFDINLAFITIKTEELLKVFRKEKDPFVLLEEEILKIKEKYGTPVIVFDEIQDFKDIYINGQRKVVDAFFNFFVRLAKVIHLTHVIVMSSDTFFIEEVYSDSTLKNTSRYYLVDFFDDETVYNILVNEGIDKKEAKEIVEKAGGGPWILEEVLEGKEPLKVVDELYKEANAKILLYIGEKIMSGENEKEVLKVLKAVINKEFPKSKEFLKEMRNLVDREILFYNPINRGIRFKTRLDELAAREILNNR
ncbi:MAG: hypothetical protein J7L34_05750 [Thermotogaceae bacterium]|nr:hypothetical protein [Thermotogaceae bacterium]